MGRIPENEIERLKKEVSVERLAMAKGVKLKGHGKDLLGLCPFHEDREPSLVITPEKRPHEVSDVDPDDRPLAPVPATGEGGGAPRRAAPVQIEVTKGDIAVANRL